MMSEPLSLDKWGYFAGICMLLLIWVVFYVMRRELRSRILVMSAILLPLAPLGQYYFLQDYWHPPLIVPIRIGGATFGGLADLLFSFSLGGIACAAFPILAHQIPVAATQPRRWIAFAFLAIEGVSVIGLTQFLHINSIFSSSLGFVVTALIIMVVRRDLIGSSIISGVVSGIALAGAEGILSFVVPLYLSRYWYLYHTVYGLLIFGRVPLTELMWGMAFGMVIGPIFYFYKGQTFISARATARSQVSKSSSELRATTVKERA